MFEENSLMVNQSMDSEFFDLGKIQKSKHRSLVKTAEKYRDRNGVLRYKGSRHLKGTQFPG